MAQVNDFCEKIEENLQPIPDLHYTFKAKDFVSAIDNLYLEIDRDDSDLENWDSNEIVYSESKLRSVIDEKFVLILQKSCDLDPFFFQPKMNLESLVKKSYQIRFSIALATSRN